ncbi:MAG: hypothetical protein R3292_07315 [Alcanivorax sp.]|nr:hypothetical protein [Alcanivorax sp.]
MTVVVGGLIIIWLGLTMGAALLRALGVQLHLPAQLAAPLLLALLETLLFLLFIPRTSLVPESWGWPLAGGLTGAAWLINATISGHYWYRHRAIAGTETGGA